MVLEFEVSNATKIFVVYTSRTAVTVGRYIQYLDTCAKSKVALDQLSFWIHLV